MNRYLSAHKADSKIKRMKSKAGRQRAIFTWMFA